jgi:hypothetical protein
MPAERCRAASLYRSHDAALGSAEMAGLRLAERLAVALERGASSRCSARRCAITSLGTAQGSRSVDGEDWWRVDRQHQLDHGNRRQQRASRLSCIQRCGADLLESRSSDQHTKQNSMQSIRRRARPHRRSSGTTHRRTPVLELAAARRHPPRRLTRPTRRELNPRQQKLAGVLVFFGATSANR